MPPRNSVPYASAFGSQLVMVPGSQSLHRELQAYDQDRQFVATNPLYTSGAYAGDPLLNGQANSSDTDGWATQVPIPQPSESLTCPARL